MTSYCFGEMPDQERWSFEAHLLECDACWQEVQRLDASVRILRSDRSLSRETFFSSVIGVIGVSSDLRKRFGGRQGYAIAVSIVWGFLFGISVPMELAYQYETLGSQPWLALAIWLWMTGAGVLGFYVAVKGAQREWRVGLPYVLAVPTILSVIMYLLVRPHLPDYGITGSPTLHAATAQSAFLKTLLYFVPFAAVFIFNPFHTIVSMQRELLQGRYQGVLGLITGAPEAIAPKGIIFTSMRVLVAFFGAATIVSFTMLMNLIDHLSPGPNMNRFTLLVELRWGVCFLLGVIAIGWYQRMLTEIKRECVAVRALLPRQAL